MKRGLESSNLKQLGRYIITAFVIGVVLAALSFAGADDMETQQMIQDDYCQRVADGTHRNYKDDIDCGEVK